jgi:hypothetical protein
MINYILLTIFIALQCGDFYTTYTILKTGKGHEANPILATLMAKLDMAGVLAFFKLACILIGIMLMPYWWALALLDILYVWVIFNNFKVLRG